MSRTGSRRRRTPFIGTRPAATDSASIRPTQDEGIGLQPDSHALQVLRYGRRSEVFSRMADQAASRSGQGFLSRQEVARSCDLCLSAGPFLLAVLGYS